MSVNLRFAAHTIDRHAGYDGRLLIVEARISTTAALGAGACQADLVATNIRDSLLVVDDVPPGVYHLRVRAIHTIGKSGASPEIRVIVPRSIARCRDVRSGHIPDSIPVRAIS